MLLEWGHNYILSNNLENNNNPITPRIDFVTTPLKPFFEGKTQEDILKAIKDQRKNDKYNYDAMLGKVTNFTWKFNADGSYDIDLNLLGYGDIIESLKINTIAEGKSVQSNAQNADNKAKKAQDSAETAQKNLENLQKSNTIGKDLATLRDDINRYPISLANVSVAATLFNISNYGISGDIGKIVNLQFPLDTKSAQEAVNLTNSDSIDALIQNINLLGLQNESTKQNRDEVVNIIKTSVPKINTQFKKALNALKAVDSSNAAVETTKAAAEKAKQQETLAPVTSVLTKNSSKLNLQLYDWRQEALGKNANNEELYKLTLKTSGGDDASKNNLLLEYVYVRLGFLLEWIQNNLLYYDNTKNSNPIFKINTDKDNNYCLRYPTQISSDPKICVIPSTLTCEDIETVGFDENISWNILSDLNAKAKYVIDNDPYKGKLMNIFVNIDYTAKCVSDNTDSNGKTNLFKFLTSLLNNINDALGNVNKLEPVFDAELNELKIIEGSGLNNEPNSEIAIFQTFGIGTIDIPKGSFITNVDFQVQLPPNMAAMATISAQANGNIVGENATGLSRLNTGFVDRVITTKLSKDMIEGGDTGDKAKKTIKTNLQQINKLVQTIYTDKNYPINDIGSFRSINRDVSLYLTGEQAKENKAPAPFFIPFNLSLTMTGLSGMVNYERFAVTEDILPYSYRSGDQGGVIDFLIKGISHSIKDNKWTTKIESLSVSSIRKKK